MELIAEIARGPASAVRLMRVTLCGAERITLQEFDLHVGRKGSQWIPGRPAVVLRPDAIPQLMEALRQRDPTNKQPELVEAA